MCAKQNRSMACSRDKFQPTRKFKKLSSPQPIPDLQAGKIAQNYEHMTSHVPRLTHTHSFVSRRNLRRNKMSQVLNPPK